MHNLKNHMKLLMCFEDDLHLLRSALLIETFAKHIFKFVDIIRFTKTFLELKPVMISHSCFQFN